MTSSRIVLMTDGERPVAHRTGRVSLAIVVAAALWPSIAMGQPSAGQPTGRVAAVDVVKVFNEQLKAVKEKTARVCPAPQPQKAAEAPQQKRGIFFWE